MPRDLPIDQLLLQAGKVLKEPGTTVFFKFTCEHCHSRQTFMEPNTLYAQGKCEKCGHVTTITQAGFTLVIDTRKAQGG